MWRREKDGTRLVRATLCDGPGAHLPRSLCYNRRAIDTANQAAVCRNGRGEIRYPIPRAPCKLKAKKGDGVRKKKKRSTDHRKSRRGEGRPRPQSKPWRIEGIEKAAVIIHLGKRGVEPPLLR